MSRITLSLSTFVMTALLFSMAGISAAENRTPSPEEFKEIVRQYNESGKVSGLQRGPQTPKSVEQFNRAVTLHTKKDATARDLKEAAALYQTASDGGIPQASTNLALLYLEGKGVKKDVKKALSLLNSASAKNETQADIALARLYLTGKDVKRDEKKGEALLNKAAKAGNPNASKMLVEFREWKKKNELAMKEYQELLKKVQMTPVKAGTAASIPPLQFMPQSPAGLPFPYRAPEIQFPVIPGYGYIATSRAVSAAVRVAAPSPQPINIVPDGKAVLSPITVK
jgi:hypothetical protein